MIIVRSLDEVEKVNVRTLLENSTVGVTVGNFDAFHLGHQALIRELDSTLRASATPERPICKILMTFWPHPRQVLRSLRPPNTGNDAPAPSTYLPLCSFRERIHIAESFGFDIVFAVHFTKRFAAMPPEQFLKDFIFAPLRPAVVVVGHDWGFGKGRAGGTDLLRAEATKNGGTAVIVPSQTLRGVQPAAVQDGDASSVGKEPYSGRLRTSAIKAALQSGDLDAVEAMLGRPYQIEGTVRHGDHRGRLLGFPTANIRLAARVLPPFGVYAVWASYKREDETALSRFPAVANLGMRPTFGGVSPRLEVHLLDGEHHLYGEHLRVQFVAALREETRFPDIEALKSAIAADCLHARKRLKRPLC